MRVYVCMCYEYGSEPVFAVCSTQELADARIVQEAEDSEYDPDTMEVISFEVDL